MNLRQLIEAISEIDPLHGVRLQQHIKRLSPSFESNANDFLGKYSRLLQAEGKGFDFAIDCYLRMCNDVRYETIQFIKSGTYSCKSFEEANKNVYSNPDVMSYYMHALILSNFLWHHHYQIWEYFTENIGLYNIEGLNYLEVGGGHGLYLSEAIKHLDKANSFTMVDISKTSIEMAKRFVGAEVVDYVHEDIYKFKPMHAFDFITMGEVLEHVEDPVSLLSCLENLLSPSGVLFITAPTNAPAIDHIYLFRGAQDIRECAEQAGLRLIRDHSFCTENTTIEEAEARKIATLYGGYYRKG